jgi:hypothetical protein
MSITAAVKGSILQRCNSSSPTRSCPCRRVIHDLIMKPDVYHSEREVANDQSIRALGLDIEVELLVLWLDVVERHI